MPGKYAVIFNGPPNSGKDSACNYLQGLIADDSKQVHHMRFKDHLFDCTTTLFNIDREKFMELYNDRELKEQKTCWLYGMSPREAMIYTSEEVIKPKFGKSYFGDVAAENMKYGLSVFSDGGFTEEFEPVYTECDGRMLIIQIIREDCDFSNDSRNYIDEFKDVEVIKLINNSDQFFFMNAGDIVLNFLERYEHA